MSLKTLEREILMELNRLTIFKRRLKPGDILEWNTSEETVKKNLKLGETAVFASLAWVAVKAILLKPIEKGAAQPWARSKNRLSTGNMAARIVTDHKTARQREASERFLAIAAGLTHEQAVEYVTPFLGSQERIDGFYKFS